MEFLDLLSLPLDIINYPIDYITNINYGELAIKVTVKTIQFGFEVIKWTLN